MKDHVTPRMAAAAMVAAALFGIWPGLAAGAAASQGLIAST
jgi:hypothetical protein